MRILYIHQYFITPNEAGGTRSYWFAKELVEKGHQVIMLTSRSKQEKFIERVNIEGIEVIYIRNSYDNKMSIISRIWSFFKFMSYSTLIGLKQKKIDLVYATSTPLTIGIPALVIKFLKRTKYIFEVRDLWPEVPIQMGAINNKLLIRILKRFESRLYKSAVHVVALSPGMKDGILKMGTSESKVTLLPNMSKKDEFYKRPLNKEVAAKFGINLLKFNAVHFGTMGIANGLDYVIDAAVLLKEEGAAIDIIFLGGGKTEADLKAICVSKGLDNVKFLGSHPMSVVSEIVNICDCSIVTFADIPILATNSPNKLFDSLSAEKAIIVNSNGWTKDMVEDNGCGVYVDVKHPAELKDALIKMSVNKAWVDEMAKNSRTLAENVYDKSILCKQFVNIVERNCYV